MEGRECPSLPVSLLKKYVAADLEPCALQMIMSQQVILDREMEDLNRTRGVMEKYQEVSAG